MYRDMRMVFREEDSIRCMFHNVVVKLQSLREKYPGGVKAFTEEYHPICNKHLSVACSMNPCDLDRVVSDLEGSGFVPLEDFVCFDGTDWNMIVPEHVRAEFDIPSSSPVDLKVNWLDAHTQNGGTVIRYVENPVLPKVQEKTKQTKTGGKTKKKVGKGKESSLANRTSKIPKTPEKPEDDKAMPPKEECQVLYYGSFDGDDEIIFLPKEIVEFNIKIHGAMYKAEEQGLTWGQVRNRYPNIWSMLEDIELTTFQEWLEEQEQDSKKNEKLHVLTSPEKEFMNESKWDRMPLPEEPFDPQLILEHYPSLQSPYDGSREWIPSEIIDEFGTEQQGIDLDGYVTFQVKDLRKVIRAFRLQGFICKREDSKIDSARGL